MLNSFRLFLALLLLNSALSFQNRWPTVGVRWVPEFSLDLVVLLLVLTLLATWRGVALGHATHKILFGVFLLLVLGRYLDVTVPALMGRPIDLYWDSQYVPHVVAMFLDGVGGWQGGLALLALLVLLLLIIVLLHWAFRVLIAALAQPVSRRGIMVLALTLLAVYGAGRLNPRWPLAHGFALPVSGMWIEQAKRALDATVFRDHGRIAAQPPLPTSDLSRLGSGDLFVIFFESYGALVFDDPRFATPLGGDFAALEETLSASGWRVVSARVESSTFGGSSWLAHSSLLSGLRIADQGDYRDLLASNRATLASRVAAAGYRTIAVMPGLKYPWPEGSFYRFDRIYDAEQLKYPGPAYGWWAIPDQYSLYHIYQDEVAPANRAPLLVFYPTINSHAPFTPLPPYHPDWRFFDAAPAVTTVKAVELNDRLDGRELASAYVQSVRYNLAILGGYLREYAPKNALFLVLGDHQPPAVVSGQGRSWQVPVHLFSRDPALLAAFEQAGFQRGLTPGPTALGGIEMLTSLLLRTLDSPPPATLEPSTSATTAP
ncbi:MAG: sulfatase-like hydrolase/transferase [Phycisphaerales bacterium]|nr:sulfatase-like hydrolase/transferase [Phycisphaerales bacterium]